MSSEQAMREAMREAGVDAPLRFDDLTDSTNATALRLAEEGSPEWTLVVAGHQTAGRGRLGRSWLSEPGKALLFSVVLRPDIEAERAGLITLLAGVAMAEAARVSCGADVRCKWPNDLLVGGRKAGGILAEASVTGRRPDYVVLGAGVNVRGVPRGMAEAASLGGGDPAVLLSAFLWCFKQRYRPDTPGFGDAVIDAYRAVSATLGRQVRAVTLDGRSVEGVAVDLGSNGDLILSVEGDRERVAFGEIEHLR